MNKIKSWFIDLRYLDERQWGHVIGIVGLLIFLAVQINYHTHIMVNRSIPVEPDDAYGYLLKSVEYQKCFMQDCPALQDIWSQVASPPVEHEYSVEFIRFRVYFRLFIMYHPLHAFIMDVIQRFGLTWEETFNAQIILGTILIGTAMYYWLSVIWNPASAGIAMAWLCLYFFPGQGLQYIVPTNWALGFSFLFWALIVTRRKSAGWILPVGSLILVLTHTVGVVYSVVGIFMYAVFEFLENRRLDRKSLAVMGISLSIIVVVSFVLPEIITKPVLKPLLLEPSVNGWTIFQGWKDALMRVRDIFRAALGYLGGGIIVSLIGIVFAAINRNTKAFVTGVILLLLLFASLFYMIPRVPAELFARTWGAAGSYLAGAMGYALWIIYRKLANWLHEQKLSNLSFRERINRSFLGNIFGVILLTGTIIVTAMNVGVEIDTYNKWIQYSIDRHNYSFDVDQPKILTDRTPVCSDVDVLYTSEDLFFFYLVNGAMDCGAVYFPAIIGTPDEKNWFLENEKIQYLATQPFYPIILSPQTKLEIQGFPQNSSYSFYAFLENPAQTSADVSLYSESLKPDLIAQFILPPHWSGWKQIVVHVQNGDPSEMRFEVKEGTVRLKGLRLTDADDGFYWPWNSDIELLYSSDGVEETSIGFKTSDLYPRPLPNITVNVLSDNGDVILAEITRK